MLATFPTTSDFRAPDYNPSSGMFVSEVPIGFKGSNTNLFSMASNTPTVFIDLQVKQKHCLLLEDLA